jgi:sulfite reductase (NADPH) flavoprotein alpha-component
MGAYPEDSPTHVVASPLRPMQPGYFAVPSVQTILGVQAQQVAMALRNQEECKVKIDGVGANVAEKPGDIGKYLAFGPQYQSQLRARPDVAEGELVRVTDWKLLTPPDYDRTCFHFEIDVKGTVMENLVNGSQGKALSVYATNDPEKVTEFLKLMKLDPDQVVSVEDLAPQAEEGTVVLTSVFKLFSQYLDIFGKPTREFLKKLFPFARDVMEKVAIAELTLERKTEEFQDRQARAMTFADYLVEYKSLEIPVDKYVDLIPTIKQRVYSICSSSDYHPGKCQLLVVREDWQAKDGQTKFGLCSSFLTFIRPGTMCVAHSTHSVMQIPEDKTAHIFMAGLGTGLAPFRAFIEQRKFEKTRGHTVGPMTLFFGGRYSKSEYYYRDEFEAFEAEGLVKCCNAWSRDGAQKVYVQHKITEEADSIWANLGAEGSKGYFFLCGSKQPEKDVFAAILKIFQDKGKMTAEQAQKKMDELQAGGRYVTEVY